jgi:septal ring factor EnvC (AmiA/AmiB activator)
MRPWVVSRAVPGRRMLLASLLVALAAACSKKAALAECDEVLAEIKKFESCASLPAESKAMLKNEREKLLAELAKLDDAPASARQAVQQRCQTQRDLFKKSPSPCK